MKTLWFSSISILVSLLTTLCISGHSEALDWQDVAADLMSPACPGRTLLNCTSGQAEQWREIIRQKLLQGETKEQILQYFVGMRGEEILAAPPKRGFALTVWLFPLLVIVNGAGLIIVLTRRWVRQRSAEAESLAANADIALPSESTPVATYRDRLQRELEDFTT
jgi:cytochrome c-type biogenesis protein CcmH